MALRKDILILLGFAIITTLLVIVALYYFDPNSLANTVSESGYEFVRPSIEIGESQQSQEELLLSLSEQETSTDTLSLLDLFEIPSLESDSSTPNDITRETPSRPSLQQQSIPSAQISQAAQQQTSPAASTPTPSTVTASSSNNTPQTSSRLSQEKQSYASNSDSPSTKQQTVQITSIEESQRLYWVQLLSTSSRSQLERARAVLQRNSIPTLVKILSTKESIFFRLRVGPFLTKSNAQRIMDTILEDNLFSEGLIVSSTR